MTDNDIPVVAFFKRLLDPFLVWGLLIAITRVYDEKFTGYYLGLMIITFFISSYVFEQTSSYRKWRQGRILTYTRDIMIGWSAVILILLFLDYAANFSHHYSKQVIVTWFIATPIALLLSHITMRLIADKIRKRGKERSAVIVGANDTSLKLVKRIVASPYTLINIRGFFDSRCDTRIADGFGPRLGEIESVADYIRSNHTDMIFISLPMSSQPTMRKIMDDLHDATASIYFLPDTHFFDLMQARFNSVEGIPVVSICDSPYSGIDQVVKNISDYILALFILLLISPLLLVIALLIKLTSSGPVLFKQHRYGLNGEQIIVYKFRTMCVSEDGSKIEQAHLDDPRITKIGKFLRRTSLDELPQFINVLQGRMSIVGPRPHAVAHNELYRKLIKGYMLRHKVKPGITGWAQVNGFRGETDQLDKMQGRIDYDIQYLNNWSLWLDLWIIFRTVLVVLRKENAH